MTEPIPNDMRRVSIRHLLLITTTFGIAFAIYRAAPHFGLLFTVALFAFWLGFSCLFFADVVDQRPIDDRTFISKLLGVVGALTVWLSLLGMVVMLPAAAVEYRSSKIPQSKKVFQEDDMR